MKLFKILISTLCVLIPLIAWSDSLKVSPSELDLGTLKEGPPVVKKVVITNTGAEDVTIGNVKAS